MQMEFVHSNREVVRQALELFLTEAHNHILGDTQTFKIRFLENKDYLEFVVETVPNVPVK